MRNHTHLPLLLFALLSTLSLRAQDIVINEIQVCNTDLIIDPSYNYGAWMEIYNPGSNAYTLSGKYVTDDEDEPKKFLLPSTIEKVPAKGFTVLWFDHNKSDGNFGGKSYNQIRFKPNVEGGKLFIFDSKGNKICEAKYPAGIPRCSYALTGDGGHYWAWTATPTPGASNLGSIFATKRLDAPVIPVEGGVYNEGERVSFKVSIPTGTKLIYTTNGSTPTLTNGSQITTSSASFNANSTKIYRFALFRDGYLPSPVVTRSFIFKNHEYYLPIISVVTDKNNLYDNTIGIYCVGTNGISGRGVNAPRNWNMDWERPVNMEYMVPETNSEGETSFVTYVNQELDMEICGGWSRGYGEGETDGKYWDAKSSFRLKCDKEYEGVNSIDYPVFPLKPFNKYKVWQVRNGGNDTYARIIDPSLSQIALRSNFNLDAQDCQPAHIFFNGQYLGMFNIRESNNRHYGYSNWGIDTDDMDQFELSGGYKQMVGTDTAWKEMVALTKQLSSDQSEETYRQVSERLDIEEFINYMAYCIYMGPSDWMNNANNMKGYRSVSDNGKFRLVLFDMDSAMSNDNMIGNMMKNSYGSNMDDLFRYLMAYPPVRRKFVDAYCLVDGSLFAPERCAAIIDELYNERQEALSFEGNSTNKNMASTIKRIHNGTRMTNLQSTFSLPDPYALSISSNLPEARLIVNEQIIPTGEFEGYLYPISNSLRLTALSPAGYTLSGWHITTSSLAPVQSETIVPFSSQWEYYDQGSLDGVDWKALDYNGDWPKGSAPLGYANSGSNFDSSISTRLDYGGDSSKKRTTYYFRKRFYVEETPSPEAVYQFHYRIDDGLRLYLNGKDIDGFRVSAGAKYSFTCSDYTGNTADEGIFTLPSADLHQGWNVLAVEVHNNSLSSSDIYFDGQLQCLFYDDSELEHTVDSCSFNLPDVVKRGSYSVVAEFTPITDPQVLAMQEVTPIRINEVSAGNDIHINDYGKRNDWIELYNTTSEEIDITGMYLSDDIGNPQKWQVTALSPTTDDALSDALHNATPSTIIAPHGTLVIWCDKQDPITQLHAPFKLDNADGAVVTIQSEDGSWTDCLEYLKQPHRQTFGRFPDGSNYTTLMNWPTINSSNLLSAFVHEDYTYPDNSITKPTTITLVDAHIVSRQYFNLQGQKISRPQGICIEKVIMSDGSAKVRKVKY